MNDDIDITPARLGVLNRVIDAGEDGFRPLGPDWVAVYWLRDRYLVQAKPKKPYETPRFLATAMGKSVLKFRRSA